MISDLKWTQEKDSWKLSNGEDSLLTLGKKIKNHRSLLVENRFFNVLIKGSWNPVWIIETERKELILEMKFGFWSSKGKIRFRDGGVYECRFINRSKQRISLHDLRYQEELISFESEKGKSGKSTPKMIIHQKEVATDKLLFLIGLGMALYLQFQQDDGDFTTTFLLLNS